MVFQKQTKTQMEYRWDSFVLISSIEYINITRDNFTNKFLISRIVVAHTYSLKQNELQLIFLCEQSETEKSRKFNLPNTNFLIFSSSYIIRKYKKLTNYYIHSIYSKINNATL